jgi:hypothetical protein
MAIIHLQLYKDIIAAFSEMEAKLEGKRFGQITYVLIPLPIIEKALLASCLSARPYLRIQKHGSY